MKFQEGDRVMVKSTGERGTVVEWISKKMLEIEVEGIRFPVYADQIDFPYYDDFTKAAKQATVKKINSSDIPAPEKSESITLIQDGIKFSFFPVLDQSIFDEDVIDYFKIYFVNQIGKSLSGRVELLLGNQSFLEVPFELRPSSSVYLFDFPLERLNDQPFFKIKLRDASFPTSESSWRELDFRPKPKLFFKLALNTVEQKNASFEIKLAEDLPEVIVNSKVNDHGSLPPLSEKDPLDVLSKTGFRIKSNQKRKRRD